MANKTRNSADTGTNKPRNGFGDKFDDVVFGGNEGWTAKRSVDKGEEPKNNKCQENEKGEVEKHKESIEDLVFRI